MMIMFDDDDMMELVPLSPNGNVERATKLADDFLSDLRGMSDRPHQIEIWMLPFDEVPRRWKITELSDDELSVVDVQHRVVVMVRDSLDNIDVCVEVANITPKADNVQPCWNDMLAILAVIDAVEQTFAYARAGAIEVLADGWGWDLDGFMNLGALIPNDMKLRVLETMVTGASAVIAADGLQGSSLAGHALDRELLLAAAESCRSILEQVVGALVRGAQGERN
jgi:hypothetical protein